ncbi:MAG: hypothetical protein FWE36_00990 [Erysipelotrichales bacterium]|nr:hypothetical protein [Erysipelotrichales bacterium]
MCFRYAFLSLCQKNYFSYFQSYADMHNSNLYNGGVLKLFEQEKGWASD